MPAIDLRNCQNLLNESTAARRPDRTGTVSRNNDEASVASIQPITSGSFAWLAVIGCVSANIDRLQQLPCHAVLARPSNARPIA
jgi:hypothetical protein